MKLLKFIIVAFVLFGVYLWMFQKHDLTKNSKLFFKYEQQVKNIFKRHERKNNSSSLSNSLKNSNFKKAEIIKKFSGTLSVNSLLVHNDVIKKISSQTTAANSSLYNESSQVIDYPDVYVSEYNSNDVSRCKSQDNTHYICSVFLTGLLGPVNMLINNNILYVLNGSNSTITYCSINNNILGWCGSINAGVSNPSYLITNTNNQLLISDNSVKNLAICNLDPATGNIISCTKTNNINSYTAFYFKKSNYNGLVYYPNYSNNAIDICNNINESAACIDFVDKSIIKPFNLVIANNTAYIVNSGPSVTRCAINQNGILDSCIIIGSNFNSPAGIAINK
jgi:hypothetical protein